MKIKHSNCSNSILRFLLIWLLLFAVCFLIRIPYFTSNSYWFDGDEGIVGVMANDFLRTGKLPFLLYGQNYGFASIEVVSAGLFISLFGKGVMSLKLAGLFIHSFGLAFLIQGLLMNGVRRKTLIFVFVLIVCFPPFLLWAAQMRTLSFTFACILFFICISKEVNLKWIIIALIISFFCFLSQPFMYLFVAPIVGVWLLKEGKGKEGFILYVLTLGISILGSILILGNQNGVHQVALNFGEVQLDQFITQSSGFLSGFTGFHYFTMDVEIPVWWRLISIFSVSLLIGYAFVKLWFNSKLLILFFTLAFILFLFALSFFVHYSPRYWISFFGGLLILFLYSFIIYNPVKVKIFNRVSLILSVFFVVGISVTDKFKLHFYDTIESERNCFWKLENQVMQSDVKVLYTTDVYLQWQWNYLLGDKVPCTSFNKEERTNLFLHSVEKVAKESPDKVGMIGFYGITEGLESDSVFKSRIEQVGEKYYFVRNVRQKDVVFGQNKALQ